MWRECCYYRSELRMVLTEQELVLAINKSQRDRRIRSALFTRRKTINFSEQAACDREIQRYLCLKGTLVYRFNCCIIHQPWRFNQVTLFQNAFCSNIKSVWIPECNRSCYCFAFARYQRWAIMDGMNLGQLTKHFTPFTALCLSIQNLIKQW